MESTGYLGKQLLLISVVSLSLGIGDMKSKETTGNEESFQESKSKEELDMRIVTGYRFSSIIRYCNK